MSSYTPQAAGDPLYGPLEGLLEADLCDALDDLDEAPLEWAAPDEYQATAHNSMSDTRYELTRLAEQTRSELFLSRYGHDGRFELHLSRAMSALDTLVVSGIDPYTGELAVTATWHTRPTEADHGLVYQLTADSRIRWDMIYAGRPVAFTCAANRVWAALREALPARPQWLQWPRLRRVQAWRGLEALANQHPKLLADLAIGRAEAFDYLWPFVLPAWSDTHAAVVSSDVRRTLLSDALDQEPRLATLLADSSAAMANGLHAAVALRAAQWVLAEYDRPQYIDALETCCTSMALPKLDEAALLAWLSERQPAAYTRALRVANLKTVFSEYWRCSHSDDEVMAPAWPEFLSAAGNPDRTLLSVLVLTPARALGRRLIAAGATPELFYLWAKTTTPTHAFEHGLLEFLIEHFGAAALDPAQFSPDGQLHLAQARQAAEVTSALDHAEVRAPTCEAANGRPGRQRGLAL